MFYEHIEIHVKQGEHFSVKKVFTNVDEKEELAQLKIGELVDVELGRGPVLECVVTNQNIMSGGWGLNMEYELRATG